jgi:hypothetical protein
MGREPALRRPIPPIPQVRGRSRRDRRGHRSRDRGRRIPHLGLPRHKWRRCNRGNRGGIRPAPKNCTPEAGSRTCRRCRSAGRSRPHHRFHTRAGAAHTPSGRARRTVAACRASGTRTRSRRVHHLHRPHRRRRPLRRNPRRILRWRLRSRCGCRRPARRQGLGRPRTRGTVPRRAPRPGCSVRGQVQAGRLPCRTGRTRCCPVSPRPRRAPGFCPLRGDAAYPWRQQPLHPGAAQSGPPAVPTRHGG